MIKKCILFSALLMGGFTGVFAIKISSVAELIEQIGSNKTLELEPGLYNLGNYTRLNADLKIRG